MQSDAQAAAGHTAFGSNRGFGDRFDAEVANDLGYDQITDLINALGARRDPIWNRNPRAGTWTDQLSKRMIVRPNRAVMASGPHEPRKSDLPKIADEIQGDIEFLCSEPGQRLKQPRGLADGEVLVRSHGKAIALDRLHTGLTFEQKGHVGPAPYRPRNVGNRREPGDETGRDDGISQIACGNQQSTFDHWIFGSSARPSDITSTFITRIHPLSPRGPSTTTRGLNRYGCLA